MFSDIELVSLGVGRQSSSSKLPGGAKRAKFGKKVWGVVPVGLDGSDEIVSRRVDD